MSKDEYLGVMSPPQTGGSTRVQHGGCLCELRKDVNKLQIFVGILSQENFGGPIQRSDRIRLQTTVWSEIDVDKPMYLKAANEPPQLLELIPCNSAVAEEFLLLWIDLKPVESLEIPGAVDLKHRDWRAELVHILSYQLPLDLF